MRPPRFFAPPPTRTTFSFSECLFIVFGLNGYSCFVFSICEKHLDEILTSFNSLTFRISGHFQTLLRRRHRIAKILDHLVCLRGPAHILIWVARPACPPCAGLGCNASPVADSPWRARTFGVSPKRSSL